MCGRYKGPDTWAELHAVLGGFTLPEFEDRAEIRPTNRGPIVLPDADGAVEAVAARWSLIPNFFSGSCRPQLRLAHIGQRATPLFMWPDLFSAYPNIPNRGLQVALPIYHAMRFALYYLLRAGRTARESMAFRRSGLADAGPRQNGRSPCMSSSFLFHLEEIQFASGSPWKGALGG